MYLAIIITRCIIYKVAALRSSRNPAKKRVWSVYPILWQVHSTPAQSPRAWVKLESSQTRENKSPYLQPFSVGCLTGLREN